MVRSADRPLSSDQMVRRAGSTADAENQVVIESTIASARRARAHQRAPSGRSNRPIIAP
jgi:hypothetical protein